MSRVVVVGSLNVDATSYVAEFPAPGETIRALDSRTALGGKGANQAVAVRRGGASVEFVARIGDSVAVRYCDRAIYDGHTVAREL